MPVYTQTVFFVNAYIHGLKCSATVLAVQGSSGGELSFEGA